MELISAAVLIVLMGSLLWLGWTYAPYVLGVIVLAAAVGFVVLVAKETAAELRRKFSGVLKSPQSRWMLKVFAVMGGLIILGAFIGRR